MRTRLAIACTFTPGEYSRVLLVPGSFLQEALLGLSKHEQLQHLCAVNADIKGRHIIKLRRHNIMQKLEVACCILHKLVIDMTGKDVEVLWLM